MKSIFSASQFFFFFQQKMVYTSVVIENIVHFKIQASLVLNSLGILSELTLHSNTINRSWKPFLCRVKILIILNRHFEPHCKNLVHKCVVQE